MRDVFVVAGDAEEPRGSFHGAIDLLEALDALGRPFPEVGITGYPESHPFIDDDTTIAAMFEKARHATYIVSQVCFDPAVTARWIEDVWARGTRLPIYVGVPGVVSRAKLLRVSARIGIGDSLRFLRKNGSFAGRFLRGVQPRPARRRARPRPRKREGGRLPRLHVQRRRRTRRRGGRSGSAGREADARTTS